MIPETLKSLSRSSSVSTDWFLCFDSKRRTRWQAAQSCDVLRDGVEGKTQARLWCRRLGPEKQNFPLFSYRFPAAGSENPKYHRVKSQSSMETPDKVTRSWEPVELMNQSNKLKDASDLNDGLDKPFIFSIQTKEATSTVLQLS